MARTRRCIAFGDALRGSAGRCRQKAGRILAAGFTKEVTFDPVEGAVLDSIDEAYRAKYRGNQYLERMIGARARSATLGIMPINGSRS
jgi:hypothetical protein